MKRLIIKSSKPIKLLHGTNSSVIDSILQNGLLPEGLTGNAMFNYNDYGRKGEPKHPDSVYLTNDLENAQRYAVNAVKHNDGFPVVFEAEVSEDSLSWDDDAFYKNYGDFDFGERDNGTGEWKRKPSKELWQQSLDINMQCTHAGTVKPSQFTRVFVENKWWSIENFNNILDAYSKLKAKVTPLNKVEEINLNEFKISLDNGIEVTSSILGRKIYMYSVVLQSQQDIVEKTAQSIKIMETLKENIKEFGAKVISASNLKQIGLNPKYSCFGYVFGSFELQSNDKIIEELQEKIDASFHDRDNLKNVIDGKASSEEFDELYEFNPDFIEDVINYCKNILGQNDKQVIDTLKLISQTYHDSYEQISAEIEYLEHNNY